MICQEVEKRMHRYIDHDLTEQEKEQLFFHMKTCKSCSEKFEILQKLSDNLERLPDVIPPFSLVDRIMPQLDEIEKGRKEQGSTIQEMKKEESILPLSASAKSKPQRFMRTRLGRVLIGTAAAAVVLGVAVYQFQPEQLNQADIDNHYMDSDETDTYSVTGSGGRNQQEENTTAPERAEDISDATKPSEADVPVESKANVKSDQPTVANEMEQDKPSAAKTPDSNQIESKSSVIEDTPKESTSDKIEKPNSSANKGQTSTLSPDKKDTTTNPVEKSGVNPNQSSDKGKTLDKEKITPENPDEQSILPGEDNGTSGTASEPSVSSVPSSAISILSLDEDSFPSLERSVSPRWLSPDGQYLADYKDNKLSIFRLDGTKKDQKTLLQEIEVKGTYVKGSWSEDSLTYNYDVEIDGKATKLSYTLTKEDQQVKETDTTADKNTTTPQTNTDVPSQK